MKFKIKRDVLANVLAVISASVPMKNETSATDNLLYLEIQNPDCGNQMQITAGGGVSLFTTNVGLLEIDSVFNCLIQYKQLLGTIKLLKEDLEFDIKNGWAYIKSGASRLKIPSPIMDYPYKLKEIGQNVSIDPRLLSHLLSFVDIASAKEDFAAWALKCLNLTLDKDGKLKIIACDGRELARAILPIDNPDKLTFDFLINNTQLSGIKRMLDDCNQEHPILISVGDNNSFQIQYDETILNIRTAQGKFPNAEMIIPETINYIFQFNIIEFQDILKRAAHFSNAGLIKITFERMNAIFETNSQNGSYSEILEYYKIPESSNDSPIETFLYISQLQACLSKSSSEGDIVKFFINSGKSPIMIREIVNTAEITYITIPEVRQDILKEALKEAIDNEKF